MQNKKILLYNTITNVKNYIKTGVIKKEFTFKKIQSLPPYKKEIKNNTAIKENINEESVLLEIQKNIENCMRCSLCQNRTHIVFGSGNIKSPLFIVGEAPGRDEDLKGEPFVGRGGQLLTKMLEAIAIDRKDIFITNIIKCRPPENRDPKEEEIKACGPHLDEQINYGKPKYILALGRFSAGYFFNNYKSSLSDLRAQIGTSHGATVLATYHPAAVLRSPTRWKPLVWEDLKKLAHLLLKENYYNNEQIEVLKTNKVIE